MPTAQAMELAGNGRLEALKARHAALDMELGELQKSPLPHAHELRELKRQKLELKDEIENLS